MKKIVLLIGMLIPSILFSQNQSVLGGSYVNSDTYITQQDFEWISQVASPGDTIGYRDRYDKGSGSSRLIEFSNYLKLKGVKLRVIVTVSMSATGEENLSHIVELIEGGVWVDAVELFNEPYSEVSPKFDFSSYRKFFEPLTEYIRENYPYIRFLYFAAPRPSNAGINGGRKEHQVWNDSLKTFINKQPLSDGVSWHVYFNARDCSILDTLLEPVVYNSAILNQDLDYYYTRLFIEAYNSKLWDSTYAYMKKNYPNRPYAITEMGIVYGAVDDGGAGDIKNTWVYSSIMFKSLVENKGRFYELDLHAGVSQVGMISPKKNNYDSEEGINLRRTEYWCYYLANQVPDNITELKKNDVLVFSEPGEYYKFFINASDEAINISTVLNNVQMKNITGEYIKGKFRYSSAGATGWMLKGSEKTYEIDTVKRISSVEIPSISYGYIKFEIAEIPVYGCTVDSALNYNQNANKEFEPSNCYYQYQCGCKDETAINFDESAPCPNNTLCIYAEPECRRKFFRFCIKSKRNCNCSGTIQKRINR